MLTSERAKQEFLDGKDLIVYIGDPETFCMMFLDEEVRALYRSEISKTDFQFYRNFKANYFEIELSEIEKLTNRFGNNVKIEIMGKEFYS